MSDSAIGDELEAILGQFYPVGDDGLEDEGAMLFAAIKSLIEEQTKLARLNSAKTLHRNIDVWLNLIERIQPGSPVSPFINAMDLQKVICDYEDDLEASIKERSEG